MKRSRLVLVVILVAVASLVTALWVGEGPLWRWVMLRDSIYEGNSDGHAVVGHDTIYRFTGELHGDSARHWVVYYQENGFKALEERRDGEVNKDAAWYYPEPKNAAASIKGHVAFWRGVVVTE